MALGGFASVRQLLGACACVYNRVVFAETQLEGTSPQVDNRGGVRGNFGGSSISSSRSERPGFESPCGAIVCSRICSRSERGGGGGRVGHEASGSLTKRAVRARVKKNS